MSPLKEDTTSIILTVNILEFEGYEADDIIGTVSHICEKKGIECCIITGDKDDLQLASKLTKIYLTTTSVPFDPQADF